MMVLSVAPNLLTSVLLIKVHRSMKLLKRMKKVRNQIQVDKIDGEERKGAAYLMIIFTIEMIVFLLNVVCPIVFHQAGTPIVCNIWNGFIKAPYTIANTIIYGWKTKAYQRHVRHIFGCQMSSDDMSEMSISRSRWHSNGKYQNSN